MLTLGSRSCEPGVGMFKLWPWDDRVKSYPTLLRRSVANRHIAGVCGGLAEYLGIDPTVVRVVYVLLSIFSAGFPGILVYILLWVLIPEREYY